MDNTQKEKIEPVNKAKVANASVEDILSNFKNNIHSLLSHFHAFGELAQTADESAEDKHIESTVHALIRAGVDLPEGTNVSNFRERLFEQINVIADESPRKISNLLKDFEAAKVPAKNFEILSRGVFLMLNNYFEYLLADLLSYYYNKFHGTLNDKKLNFTLEEIHEYESIEELTKAFIIKEVESMMVKFSFEDLINHFDEVLEINSGKNLIKWDSITEYRERRHLIVHNASLVNKKYLTRAKNFFNYKIGDVVNVGKDYFLDACNEFYLAGLILSYNCWGKWDKSEEQIDECISDILDESYAFLEDKIYENAYRLAEYANSNISGRNDEQEDDLVRINFNRLIALKKLDRKPLFSRELKKVKTATAAPVYKIVHNILSDKYDNLLPLIKQAKAMEDLELENYEAWPIFDFIRDITELDKAIRVELEEDTADEFLEAIAQPQEDAADEPVDPAP